MSSSLPGPVHLIPDPIPLAPPMPGLRRPLFPRGKLARCQAEGCSWRNFLNDLTPEHTCRRHPGQTDFVPDGTRLRVRCFHDGCLQNSVEVTYWRTMHHAENFQCFKHLLPG
ncbi:hypothetical protein ACFQFC_01280 [Amorphoplanes digitatis]|uniref:Transposase n=1 Tax=Actinoplanes digitatis TaxID=1868 RepID=A0A7W7HXW6_9ACTN|nr:hypothetical protein [Actinoplanes digitatis]MBB4762807.1 transposase [Actinoplanes digitatis]GID91697.1 hypothetical protein Adi01nite_11090 [Actinoplanes digitatis]